MESPRDRVLRAVTDDGSFRVIALRTTDLVRDAVKLQQLSGHEARIYGELLTGAILIRETLAPAHRVQVVLASGAGHVSMVADSRPDGGLTRGLVTRPEGSGAMAVRPDSLVKVIRTLPRGRLHQSVVEAGSDGISGALMSYLQASEQITATLVVATVMDDARVVASGGFLVQLLPECARGPLMVMTERLNDFALLDDFLLAHDARAEVLVAELLFGFGHELLADGALVHGCVCDEERVLGALATLGRAEIDAAISASEVLELTCEYCHRLWRVGPERLRALLTEH